MTVAPNLLPLRIRLPYTTEEEFIEKYGSNVARGGVFIATRALKEEGTALAFEFVLADGTRLLRGEGVVVKAQIDEGGGRSGMTVRFVKLDAPSKVFIERLVAYRSGEPASPPEVRAAPAAPSRPVATPTPAPAASPAPVAAERRPAAPAAPPAPSVGTNAAGLLSTPPPPGMVRRTAPAPAAAPPSAPAVAPPEAVRPPTATTRPVAAPPAPQAEAPRRAEPPPQRQSPTPPVEAPFARPPEPVRPVQPLPVDPPPAAPVAPPSSTVGATRAEPPAPVQVAPPSAAPTATRTEPPPVARNPTPVDPAPASVQTPPPVAREPAAPAAPIERAPEEPPPRVEAPAPAPPEDIRRSPEFKGRRRTVLEVPVAAPVAPAAPEVVLGIDLGTTEARVAVFHEGAPRLIPTGGQEARGLPSMLAVDASGQLLVGTAAQAEAERTPRHAATGLKRLLGLRARSPRLRGFVGLPFSVTADPRGDASVELHGRVIPLTEFATHLLRELKSSAAAFLGREATRAVLSVPAHFDARQRAALREAAELAGLQVSRILNAPAAATLAYGHGRGLARKRVLVVDLGGGGLEISVVQVTGDDLEIVTTGCEPMLGGMDFDARIAEALNAELRGQAEPSPESPPDWGSLRAAAESAKVVLSEQEETTVSLRGGAQLSLSRERVEALTADLAQRVTEATREVLESSALTPQGLDAVLLVGGQSRAPLVRRRLEESLGVPVRSDVDPLGAVALGAALLGRSLLEIDSGKPGATVSDVLSVPLGVGERGGTIRRVFERNTRLPADKTLVLPVTLGPLSLALFQGPSPLVAESEYLGALHFQLERAGEAEIHFSLSQDGILSLSATLPGSKRQPVPLVTEDLDDAARDALLARSPFATEVEARPTGLFSGLRKLFGKR
ncbi:TIGR02266 family protein [Hyalangium rubrum]|uniref:TIGR02266 family protein n=1 Tax=Hyalangium rubrum TaxID=3103134 RepID=A0ABU5H527_9BACT|nr:TIGR02266 family protein [Hyalangium sp. s54d21]MDY7228435.1 TIGR02266 family protein [Hyalangium sp. s54d21]